MKTVAIIPAGGAGRRMGGRIPKQYLPLAGIPVILHTLRAFQHSPVVDDILLPVPENDIAEVRQEIIVRYGISKVSLVVPGGSQRQDSVRNALRHVGEGYEIIIVHDGVRPLVSADLIGRAISAARQFGAVAVGIPVRDTVKEVAAEGRIIKTVARERLWLTQTPQAFRRETLIAAYESAEADGFYGTDDASLVERMGMDVRMVPGDPDNIKVTTPEDLLLGDRIIRRRSLDGTNGGSN